MTSVERDVQLVRLANELEDHLDLGILYTGDAERRRQYMRTHLSLCVEMAAWLGAPELSESTRSWVRPYAVSATAGVLPPCSLSRARTLRIKEYPSSPGISMSDTSTWGRHCWSTASASGAERHVRTSAPASVRIADARLSASGSSSTTSTRSTSRRGPGSNASLVEAVGCRLGRSPAGTSASLSGSLTTKVAPFPSPGLCASTLPPCSSTRCLTSANPRPRPLCALVLELSACVKRSKMKGSTSGAMPGPVSLTTISTCELTRCK